MSPPVLLVNPNLMRPPVTPVGIDYVGQALREGGFPVELLDLAFADEVEHDIARSLAREPLLIAVSVRNIDDCYYVSQGFCLAETKQIVSQIRRYSDAPIVLGGVGFSIMPEAALRFCGCDLGIRGDGEAALTRLARCLSAGRDPGEVAGLVHRRDGQYVANPVHWPDVAALPAATRDIVDNPRYLREGGQVGFETKRGCDRPCTYCADPVAKGRRVRMRPPTAVADELASLLRQGVDCFHTCDHEFNVPTQHAKDVCKEIVRRGLGDRIQWYAYATPWGFDDELAGAMRRAGCVGVDLGADHATPEMLSVLGRRHRAAELRNVADLCRKHGLVFMYDLVLGGPGETPDSVRQVVDLMGEVQPDRVGAAVGVRIYPGTRLAERVFREEGFGPGNPNLRGNVQGNEELLRPLFYVSEQLGADPEAVVEEAIGGDPRFFFASRKQALENYNYNDNSVLCDAIRDGYRGAYWDILRRLAEAG